MRKSDGNALLVLAILVILLVAAIYVSLSVMPSSQPSVTVDASLNPDNFGVSSSATLEIQSKNQDQHSAHTLLLRFVANQLVHIFLGESELSTEDLSVENCTYTLLLQAGQKTTQPFKIKVPTLPTGIQSQEFYIRIEASIDGKMQSNLEHKVTFTVQSE